jgi:4-hydroxyphenylacetate 3-monooxygenase
VWFDGERVKDITTHPAFRRTADSLAHLFDLAHSSEQSGTLTVDGVHRAHLVPRGYQDLVARRQAHKAWAEASFGFLGRTPDYMASGIAGFAAVPHQFTTDAFDGAENVRSLHRRMAQGDLYPTFTITNPRFDRTRSASQQEHDDLVARVVEEKDGGVVVRGAKTIGTAAVFGNEILIGTIEPLAPQDVDHALCFSIPVDTPGLKFFSRVSYEAQARSVFDNPLSSRFDENDALLICDDVFVPWENVLVYRNVDLAFGQWWRTPAYTNFVHQAATRFWTKLEFLAGLAILLAKANNSFKLPPVQAQIGRIMAWTAQAKSMVLAAEAAFEPVAGGDGAVAVNKEIACAQRAMAGDVYPRVVSEIKLLAGSSFFQLPTSGYDLLNPQTGDLLSKYVRSPGHDAQSRTKLLKLAWDALGSEFAGRHEQYERFYHGAPHVYQMQQAWEGDTEACERLARACLDGYSL